MGDVALASIGIEPVSPLATEAGLQTAWLVIQTRMDDLGIAAAGMHADRTLFLEHKNLSSGSSERSGAGEAHHARANDNAIHPVHSATLVCSAHSDP